MDIYNNKANIFVCFLTLLFNSFNCDIAASREKASARQRSRHVKVLILGAGFAGIKAAETLHNNGVDDFLVLEGKDYIGGRVRHVNFQGNLIPLGAGWIHGYAPGNPLWKHAQKLNLAVHNDNYTNFIVRNGETGQVEKTSHKVLSNLIRITHKVDKIVSKRRQTGKCDVPLRSVLSMAGWHGKDTDLKKAIEFFHFDFENGVSPAVTSANSYGVAGEIGRDVIVTDKRGYAYMAEDIAQPFLHKVILNTVVTKIKHNNRLVRVTTKTGQKYTADYAIVTFSSGVLIDNIVKFKPTLPDWKIESINLMPMSYYCKLYFKFPTRFWDNVNYIMLAQKDRGAYVHWQNFDRETLMKDQHILLLTLTEDHCLRSEKLTDNQVKVEAMAVLKKAYGKRIPEPTAIMRNKWNGDPMTRGSYSNRVVGFQAEDLKRLQARVGRLWFAGEYTANDYGFLHEALNSGKETAARVIKCMRREKCPQ
eukprot:gene19244-21172_t